MKNYVQVGFTAQRTITGEFLPPIPVFVVADELKSSGLAECEEKPLHEISGLLFEKYKEKLKKEQIK